MTTDTTAKRLEAASTSVPSTPQAIVNYIHKVGRCSWLELYGIFGHETYNQKRRAEFSRTLLDLVESGQIKTGLKDVRGVPIADRFYQSLEVPRTQIHPTRPAQYKVMSAPVWVPAPCVPLRPGATDFRACPSHGARC